MKVWKIFLALKQSTYTTQRVSWFEFLRGIDKQEWFLEYYSDVSSKNNNILGDFGGIARLILIVFFIENLTKMIIHFIFFREKYRFKFYKRYLKENK